MPKRTYNPSTKKKTKSHGFMSRNKSKSRRKVLKRRILRGRKKLV